MKHLKSNRIVREAAARLILAGVLSAACSGCQVLTYEGPAGERFSRHCLGANTSVGWLAIEAGSNGVRRVELRGYRTDSTQALEVVTEAAVRGAIQGVK